MTLDPESEDEFYSASSSIVGDIDLMANPPVANFGGLNVGSLGINLIQYSSAQLATLLGPFIAIGSQRHQVFITDINLVRDEGIAMPDPLTVDYFLQFGNPLFEILFYLALPVADRPAIRAVPAPGAGWTVFTGAMCTEALFVQYFFILIRGSYSEAGGTTVGADIPNFLANVMGLSLSPYTYARRLAGFNLIKVDPRWVRHINLGALGQAAQNRLGLGVAGYRLLNPFRFLTPRAGLPANIMAAVGVAQSFYNAGYNWDFHPATRSGNVLATYGPINANLANLALVAFEVADLQALVASRALFQLPINNPVARNFTNWTVMYAPPNGDRIFPP